MKKLNIIIIALIGIIGFGGYVFSADILQDFWKFNRATGLLYSATSIPQILIGGTATTTNADLEVQGSIGLNGTAITDWSDISGSTTFIATTTATFDGVVTTSTLTGYVAANNVCASEFTDSHLCTDGEIMSYIANGGDITGWGADVSTAWYAEVAPGYLANANDCAGFTNNSNTYLGAFYIFNATTGGRGALVNCSNSKSLICCR